MRLGMRRLPLPVIKNRPSGFKHGGYGTPLYICWSNIKQRCFNRNCDHFDRWGGRGITMHAEWIHDFAAFRDYIISVLGPRPGKQYSIDRIDNDGAYCPNNLRWADAKMQNNNQRRSLRKLSPETKMKISAGVRNSLKRRKDQI